MKQQTKKIFKLTSAVLASSLFMVHGLHAQDITTAQTTTQKTSVSTDNNWTLQPAGSVDTSLTANDAFQIDTANGSVLLIANNASTGNAVKTSSGNGIHVTSAGTGGIITNFGTATGVTAGSGSAILVEAPSTITNQNGGTFTSSNTVKATVEFATGSKGSTLTNSGSGSNITNSAAGNVINTNDDSIIINNNNSGAITVSAAGNAIQINTGATNNQINNSSGGVIFSSDGVGIYINEATATINNMGSASQIAGFNAAIQNTTTGTNTKIVNSGIIGLLSSDNASIQNGPTILVNGDSFSLNNSYQVNVRDGQNAIELDSGATKAIITNTGTIDAANQPTTGNDGIYIDVSGATITNTSPGIITGNASAIETTINGSGTTINNTGSMSGVTSDTILLNESDGALTTTVSNTGTGSITTTTFNAININPDGNVNNNVNVTNTGTIQASVDLGVGINVAGATAGTINNNTGGMILTTTGAGIQVGANLNRINNAGTIQSFSAPTNALIYVNSANVITLQNGLNNSGTINAAAAANTAIDLRGSGANANLITFTNSGNVTGKVFLAGKDSSGSNNVFVMNGGTITGNVTAENTQANLLSLNGGTITGTVQMGNSGDTADLKGTALNIIKGGTGNDIFNIYAGSFNTLSGGTTPSGNDVINLFATNFTAGSINNIANIIYQNSGSVLTLGTGSMSNSNTTPTPAGSTTLTFTPGSGLIINPAYTIGLDGSLIVAGTGPAYITNNGTITPATSTATPTIDDNINGLTLTNNGSITNGTTNGTAVNLNNNFIVNNNAGATINAVSGGNAIQANGTGVTGTIDNAGTISITGTSGFAIFIPATSSTINIDNNNVMGTPAIIDGGAGGTSIGIAIAGAGNTGTISNGPFGEINSQGTNAGSGAIAFTDDYNGTIENEGLIQSTGSGTHSAGILVGSGSNTGSYSILNSGTITTGSSADNIAIHINTGTNGKGTITNFGNGTILSNNNPAILLGGGITGIENDATATGTGIITTGTFSTPNGVISVAAFSNIILPNGIVNAGNITAPSSADNAINLQAGTVSNVPVTQDAGTVTGNILLDTVGGNSFNMNGGTVIGNVSVFQTSTAANTLNLAGGTLTGSLNVGTSTNGGDTVNLSGTDINGTINSSYGTVSLPNTFNATGGSFNALNGNATPGSKDVLNVLNDFTAGTITDVETINVKNSGTFFNANGNISTTAGNNTVITVDPNTTMQVNGGIAAFAGTSIPITNHGTFIANSNIDTGTGGFANTGKLKINLNKELSTNNFVQTGSATYIPQLQGPSSEGFINGTGAGNTINLAAGTTIAPHLVAPFNLMTGDKFDIAYTPGANTIVDHSTFIDPLPSVAVHFVKSGPSGVACTVGVPGRCIELTVVRSPASQIIRNVEENEQVIGIAHLIDQLQGTNEVDFLTISNALDTLTSAQAYVDALDSLVPLANNAIPTVSREAFDSNFSGVDERLVELRTLKESFMRKKRRRKYSETIVYPTAPDHVPEYIIENGETGFNFGDVYMPNSHIGSWGRVYAAAGDQGERHEMEGYRSHAYGFIFGTDWGIWNDCITLGAAGSYTRGDLKGKTFANKDYDVDSYQASFYGWMEPLESLYVDAMIGFASHRYASTRDIAVDGLYGEARADFYGFQFGGQVDAAYVFRYQKNFIAPTVRLKYTNLDIETYTETGSNNAPAVFDRETGVVANFPNLFNLTVAHKDMNELVLGGGVRFDGYLGEGCDTIRPEFSVMVLYDFMRAKESTTDLFVGDGLTLLDTTPFETNSVKPSPTTVLFGIGFNTVNDKRHLFTVKYEYAWRKDYSSNAGYIQYFYEWV